MREPIGWIVIDDGKPYRKPFDKNWHDSHRSNPTTMHASERLAEAQLRRSGLVDGRIAPVFL